MHVALLPVCMQSITILIKFLLSKTVSSINSWKSLAPNHPWKLPRLWMLTMTLRKLTSRSQARDKARPSRKPARIRKSGITSFHLRSMIRSNWSCLMAASRDLWSSKKIAKMYFAVLLSLSRKNLRRERSPSNLAWWLWTRLNELVGDINQIDLRRNLIRFESINDYKIFTDLIDLKIIVLMD